MPRPGHLVTGRNFTTFLVILIYNNTNNTTLMVNIEDLFKEKKISRIPELELDRYENFFVCSYQDNLAHSKATLSSFPRWSIISGYYSMHDISKYLLAKQFRIKVRQDVHATTIRLIKDVVANRESRYSWSSIGGFL